MSPKTASDPWPDDLDTEIALFRYGLIAQLIHDPPSSGGQQALLRAIAAKSYRIPGSTRTQVSTTTLRRYLRAYRSGERRHPVMNRMAAMLSDRDIGCLLYTSPSPRD